MTLQLSSENLRTNSDRGLFGNDNNGSSVYYTITKLPSFFDFRQQADGSYPFNPFYPSNPFATIDQFKNREIVFRSITTGRMQWEALNSGAHQLRFVGVVGGDIFTQHNSVYSPPELQYEAQTAIPGTAVASFSQNLQYNVNLNAVHVFTPNGWLRLTSQVGTQNELKDQDIARESGQNLLGGLSIPTAGTVRGIDANHIRVVDFGVFVQSEALVDERLMLTAGMRADRSSNNGNISQLYFFPKFSGSFRIPDIKPGKLDELKFRVAYGETGNEPQYGQKFTTLNSSNIGGVGAFTLNSNLGSSIIAPERQRELETGIDVTLLQNRLQLEVTGYQRNISNLLIQRTLAPTTGYSQQVYNGASMRIRGLETVVSGFPIRDLRGVSWETHVNFAMNRGIITDLPVPSFYLGAPQTGAAKIEQGKSPTQLFGNDTLPNGTVIQDKMGDGNPDYTLGFSNTVRRGSFSIGATLDRQHGGMAGAGTWRHYDLGQNSVDYDAPGPGGMKLGQWRAANYQKYTRVYYQDASFWKLREITADSRCSKKTHDRRPGASRPCAAELQRTQSEDVDQVPRDRSGVRELRRGGDAELRAGRARAGRLPYEPFVLAPTSTRRGNHDYHTQRAWSRGRRLHRLRGRLPGSHGSELQQSQRRRAHVVADAVRRQQRDERAARAVSRRARRSKAGRWEASVAKRTTCSRPKRAICSDSTRVRSCRAVSRRISDGPSAYTNLRQIQAILTAVDKVSGYSAAQKEAVKGFVQTDRRDGAVPADQDPRYDRHRGRHSGGPARVGPGVGEGRGVGAHRRHARLRADASAGGRQCVSVHAHDRDSPASTRRPRSFS